MANAFIQYLCVQLDLTLPGESGNLSAPCRISPPLITTIHRNQVYLFSGNCLG